MSDSKQLVWLFGDFQSFHSGMAIQMPSKAVPKSILDGLRGSGGQTAVKAQVKEHLANGVCALEVCAAFDATNLFYEFGCQCVERGFERQKSLSTAFHTQARMRYALDSRRLWLKGEYSGAELQLHSDSLEQREYPSPMNWGSGPMLQHYYCEYNCANAVERAVFVLTDDLEAPSTAASEIARCLREAAREGAEAPHWLGVSHEVVSQAEQDHLLCEGLTLTEIDSYANRNISKHVNQEAIHKQTEAEERAWQEATLRQMLEAAYIEQLLQQSVLEGN